MTQQTTAQALRALADQVAYRHERCRGEIYNKASNSTLLYECNEWLIKAAEELERGNAKPKASRTVGRESQKASRDVRNARLEKSAECGARLLPDPSRLVEALQKIKVRTQDSFGCGDIHQIACAALSEAAALTGKDGTNG
jgi:hypothetical protein